jgi:hypothetical protein
MVEIMGGSFLDEDDNDESGYQPIYHGAPVAQDKRREEKVESKEGRVILTGKDLTDRKRDRMPIYSLIISFLSIFCILFTNGYLVSMLGLLLAARAFNMGTARRRTATAAVICSVTAIVLYIICVAAKPLLQDLEWYNIFMERVGRYWPL